MGRRRTILMYLVCMFLLLTGQSALAATGGGAEPARDGQTDIMAGVVVDYMGKLKFQVFKRGTTEPISGASVEIFIPSLGRYMLFGVTDEHGILELDVAYGDESNQYVDSGGQLVFTGTLLTLTNNNITYRVYKGSWLPYPEEKTVVLETKEVPQVITVYLYQKSGGGGSGGGSSGGSGGSVTKPEQPTVEAFPQPTEAVGDDKQTQGIPKTGVEGTIPYWIVSLLFFLIAGGIITYLLKTEKKCK